MHIKKTQIVPVIRRGRPIIYPFDLLRPGEQLNIPTNGLSLKEKKVSVSNSLRYYKEKNGFTWESLVALEESDIVVYRIG